MLVTDVCMQDINELWSDSEVDSDESDTSDDSDQSDDADSTHSTVTTDVFDLISDDADDNTVADNTIAASDDVESFHGQKGWCTVYMYACEAIDVPVYRVGGSWFNSRERYMLAPLLISTIMV